MPRDALKSAAAVRTDYLNGSSQAQCLMYKVPHFPVNFNAHAKDVPPTYEWRVESRQQKCVIQSSHHDRHVRLPGLKATRGAFRSLSAAT